MGRVECVARILSVRVRFSPPPFLRHLQFCQLYATASWWAGFRDARIRRQCTAVRSPSHECRLRSLKPTVRGLPVPHAHRTLQLILGLLYGAQGHRPRRQKAVCGDVQRVSSACGVAAACTSRRARWYMRRPCRRPLPRSKRRLRCAHCTRHAVTPCAESRPHRILLAPAGPCALTPSRAQHHTQRWAAELNALAPRLWAACRSWGSSW